MRRVLILAPGLFVLATAAIAASGLAMPAAGQFYLVPSPTKECRNVKSCVGVVGPWVAVNASGESTYLFGCPLRHGFVVGGTDARASSNDVRVWFDGQLGTSNAFPTASTKGGAVLLFHAVTRDGKSGSFQPIVGCVSLTQKSKRSTVAVTPGVSPAASLDLRANKVVLGPRGRRTVSVRCPRPETLVGSWKAVAFDTTGPPDPLYARAVRIETVVSGDQVNAAFQVRDVLLAPLAPRSWVQIGAMCEP